MGLVWLGRKPCRYRCARPIYDTILFMTLSRRYAIRLVAGWALFGALLFWIGLDYIGGAATFFLLAAVASWSIFPLAHFFVAALVARKARRDPSGAVSISFVAGVIIFLLAMLASGIFDYV